VINQQGKLANHVYDVPDQIDQKVALLRLKASNIQIDELTAEQKTYLENWDTNL
jgi:adenosylhomocysteinase